MQMVRDGSAVRATMSGGLEIHVEAAWWMRDGFSDPVLRAAGQYNSGRLGRSLPPAVRPSPRIGEAKGGGAARLRQLPCAVRPQGDYQVSRRQCEVLERSEMRPMRLLHEQRKSALTATCRTFISADMGCLGDAALGGYLSQ